MKRRADADGIVKRALIPIAVSLGLWGGLFIASMHIPVTENPAVYRFLMNAVHVLLFSVIGFGGALIVYPMMYFRGAGLPERTIGAMVTPLAFIIKEVYRVCEFFTIGESLYYAFSSMILLLVFGQAGLLAVSEMICRYIDARKRGAHTPVVTPLPVAGIVFSLVWLYVLLIWGLGVHWFYIYQEGYKLLFR